MRLDDESESVNFEDRTGRRSTGFGLPGRGGLRIGGGRSIGFGGIALILIAIFVFGLDPRMLLGDGQVGLTPHDAQQAGPAGSSAIDPALRSEMARVLGSTERRWQEIFNRAGEQYPPPRLIAYSDHDRSGCGAAQAAMGPFYCPADRNIYIDPAFFAELDQRFGAAGDFARAYVIAHEVGHHVQTVTGIAEQVRRAQARASKAEANALQVRMELQADCYAGVWAANDRNLLEPGDVEEGMRAAEAIGDDTLMRAAGRRPVPESFTHGSSEQRMTWLRRGLQTGDPASCDTFEGAI